MVVVYHLLWRSGRIIRLWLRGDQVQPHRVTGSPPRQCSHRTRSSLQRNGKERTRREGRCRDAPRQPRCPHWHWRRGHAKAQRHQHQPVDSKKDVRAKAVSPDNNSWIVVRLLPTLLATIHDPRFHTRRPLLLPRLRHPARVVHSHDSCFERIHDRPPLQLFCL